MVADPYKYIGVDGRPPHITPPDVTPSTPYVLTGPYTLDAGGILYFQQGPGITQDGVGRLTNSGLIAVIPTKAGADATGIQDGGENPTPHTFLNGAAGVLTVEALAGVGAAYGYDSGENPVSIQNAGVIQVVSLTGGAYGSIDDGGYYGAVFNNAKSGLVAIWAKQQGVALFYAQTGVAFTNNGLIYVNAGQAIGVYGANAFNNAGTIYAHDAAPDGGSIGVVITEAATLYSNNVTFYNSGKIEADTAFLFQSYSGNVTISNSGQVTGAINLADNSANSTVDNTGTITGAITFGSGDNAYAGATGTLSGPITLGMGVNKVTLGADGETVYGARTGGSDTIVGGTGNDFFQIYAGNNSITGGGGVDTLSFAGAANGATVNLRTGVAACNGTDAISGIAVVVGSTSFNNTLIAGAAGAELIAGNAKDRLLGGGGDDTLVAGAGGDFFFGGGGNNLFVYSKGDHRLTIAGYLRPGSANTVDIYGYSAAQSIAQRGADTIITLSSTDSIDLRVTQVSELNLATIVFIPGGHFQGPAEMAQSMTVAPAMASPHALVSAMASLSPRMAASGAHVDGMGRLGLTPLLARP